jgi:hypothetical protein
MKWTTCEDIWLRILGFISCASYAPFIYPAAKAGITLRVLLEQIHFIKKSELFLGPFVCCSFIH